ncbi:hypothetical protein NP061_007390 [Weissella confusa]|uniref:Uncharacterized protein n=1 Tax=Limosilactobacillus reuteri TaxID=1598 RepID=A0A2T5Q2E6_LIMRT|nr:hypothetical protein [Limosilactobacillus reuteri]MCW3764191.1 hypothetical protein [Weissella confusa]PTV03435.1 hypothetical protein DB325_07430 [Limosilactobacillus reuteri]
MEVVLGGVLTFLGSLIVGFFKNKADQKIAKLNAKKTVIFENKAKMLRELESDISEFASKTFEFNVSLSNLLNLANTEVNWDAIWELERLDASIKLKLYSEDNFREKQIINLLNTILGTLREGKLIEGTEVDDLVKQCRLYFLDSWQELFNEYQTK